MEWLKSKPAAIVIWGKDPCLVRQFRRVQHFTEAGPVSSGVAVEPTAAPPLNSPANLTPTYT